MAVLPTALFQQESRCAAVKRHTDKVARPQLLFSFVAVHTVWLKINESGESGGFALCWGCWEAGGLPCYCMATQKFAACCAVAVSPTAAAADCFLAQVVPVYSIADSEDWRIRGYTK
jgi:hypothetical protein